MGKDPVTHALATVRAVLARLSFRVKKRGKFQNEMECVLFARMDIGPRLYSCLVQTPR